MKSLLQEQLTNRINELKTQKLHGQKILNLIKEYLHIIVLNYLYSHKIYKNCVMFGGSVLKVLYNLPRMSVDLDFQANFSIDKDQFKKEIVDYFKNQYGYKELGVNLSQSQEKDTDVFRLTFSGLDNLEIPNITYTKLKIRLDFNKFETNQFKTILVPIRKGGYYFYLRTYPVSTLMASKIAALLHRVQYCVPDGKRSLSADYKGRDVYDFIWYVRNGIVPNLSYLAQKKCFYNDYSSLFRDIKNRLSTLSDSGEALEADLTHLYLEPDELDEWINNWRENFLGGLQNYSFVKIVNVENVKLIQNFDTDQFTFRYYFKSETNEDRPVSYQIDMSESFVLDFPIKGFKRNNLNVEFSQNIKLSNKKMLLEYAGLFYSKIEDFLKRVNYISPKLKIQTKFIQLRYEGYDPDTNIVFTDKELTTCQFEDLL
ncbi:MAG: hypothetical protein COS89_00115 [Deltaproteobacteria bacterium CG07_land_8_20_14_0_80_38_7]|nr:MAG: hypothetical protein COS89_00115 [Deltaproteobacteria bacterium CG07_land_8_20_14_0_80_38_7]